MDTKERFSERVENYVRYRPGYPQALFSYIKDRLGIGPASTVADVGAGTGIFTRLVAPFAGRVYAVEPNAPMREAAERSFLDFSNISSVDGSAEATGLPGASVDVVTAAECFHWFDPAAFRAECLRILKPGGKAAIIWNTREEGSWLTEACHRLWMQYSPDYACVAKPHMGEKSLRTFFDGACQSERFDNPQRQDRAAFIGRLLSASYSPLPGQPQYTPFLAELNALFDAHARNGAVEFAYSATLYWAKMCR